MQGSDWVRVWCEMTQHTQRASWLSTLSVRDRTQNLTSVSTVSKYAKKVSHDKIYWIFLERLSYMATNRAFVAVFARFSFHEFGTGSFVMLVFTANSSFYFQFVKQCPQLWGTSRSFAGTYFVLLVNGTSHTRAKRFLNDEITVSLSCFFYRVLVCHLAC